MKKLELKGMQMLTKEQMKNIAGGAEPTECPCTVDCSNVDDYYIGSISGVYCDTTLGGGQQLIDFCIDNGYDSTGQADWSCDNS